MTTEQEQITIDKIMSISHRIDKGGRTIVKILGKEYKLSDTKRKITNNIIDLQFEVDYVEGKSKKKQLKLIEVLDVKICSYLMLNALAYIPFVHAIHWRYLEMKYTTEVFFGITEAGLSNPETSFFLKGSILARNLAASRTQMIKVQP